MAAKKKKKAKAAKKKKAKAAKKVARKAKKPAARKKAASKKKAAPARKKKQAKGEGDYEASRAFLKDQAGFVKKNKAKIPAMGKEAEKALEGPEGEVLRAAEAAGLARSRDMF